MGKKLYVGNLSYSVSSSDLEQLFAPFGTVQSAQVIQDRETGRSKGFGFVEMGSDQEAQAEYGRLWKPIGEKYQARLATVKNAPLLVEARDAGRMLIVEFPTLEIAKACYADPAYEEAKRLALKASKRVLVILEGELG